MSEFDEVCSILIVEDDSVIAWHLESMAVRMGYRVCATVSTEAAAVDAAERYKPEVILMDVRLANGGDGVKAAEAIRATQPASIIFCTAHADDPVLRERVAGFDRSAVLGKPIWEPLLKKVIEDVTGRK